MRGAGVKVVPALGLALAAATPGLGATRSLRRVEPNRDFEGCAPASPLEKRSLACHASSDASSMSVSAVMLGHVSLK